MMNEEDPDDLSIQVTAFDDENIIIDDDSDSSEINDTTIDNDMRDIMTSATATSAASAASSTTYHNNMANGEQQHHQQPQQYFHTTLLNQFQQRMLQFPREARNLVAGGLAGMLAKSVVAPFDRIKILYQVSSAEFHIWKVPQIAYRIVQEEGMTALWKGNTATLIRVFPYSGIQFMVFDRCKTFLLKEQELQYVQQKEFAIRSNQLPPPKPKWGLTPLESLVAGMSAGAVSVIVTYPLDLTRAQLAVLRTKKDHHNHSRAATGGGGFVSTLVDNYRCRGPAGLFRGITPTLIGILPYSGLAFAFNEQAKRKIQTMTHRDLTTIERMQCGALSGLFAQTITYPLEVTRRRMQTIGIVATSGKDAAVDVVGKGHSYNPQAESAIRTVTPKQPPTMGAIIKELYLEQGVRGFFKGVSLNWFKGPIAFSISFTTFDVVQSFLETPEENRQRLPRRRTTATA